MPAVSSGIIGEANLLNLRAIKLSEVRPEVPELMMPDEQMMQAFMTVRPAQIL